jgi:DNA-binding transcriptional MerR regulator
MEESKHISIKEAAAILDVSERTVWRYIKKGALEPMKFEDRTLVERDAVYVLKTKGEIVQAVQVQSYNPETHVIVERTHYEKLIDAGAAFADGVEKATERIVMLEAANTRLTQEQTKLIEDQKDKAEEEKKVSDHIASLTSKIAQLETENARLLAEQMSKEEKVPLWRKLFSRKKKEPTWGEKVVHARKLHGDDT